MTLRLYNTLTRRKDTFTPIDARDVRLYVCGPTVYDRAHIGNARPLIVFDVLFRLLRNLYGADHVRYVRNITDVEDKINARAAERGISIAALTAETIQGFHADVAAIGCLPPTVEPRATDHIGEMIAIMRRLVGSGHAYEAAGHVLFHTPSMPDYGKLSRRSLDELVAGARVEVAPYKQSDGDFVLWKPADPSSPGWDSPWGRGRPGWHIECSAMSWKHLGEVFDIHGGGIDLIFPHHENEVAQTRCAFGHAAMANIWMHNGFLQVEGEKMSKSAGNFVTIHELVEGASFGGRRWPGEVLRLAMLRTHYRQPIDWTVQALEEAEKTLDRWYSLAEPVATEPQAEDASGWLDSLADDLNTPAMLADLHRLFADDPAEAVRGARMIGLLQQGPPAWRQQRRADLGINADRIQRLVDERLAARVAKRWADSDRLRDELAGMGVLLKDNKDGTTSWDLNGRSAF